MAEALFEPQWRTASRINLPAQSIDLWRLSLDQSFAITETLESYLSADEHARADRFYFVQDRKRFVVGRGMLRKLLGDYLGLAPAQVQFCYNRHGKPELLAWHRLHFNLSHSAGLALLAFSRARPIGVDLEQLRELNDFMASARTVLAPAEIANLSTVTAVQRRMRFYSYWTCKEAFVKARGDGLSAPVTQINIEFEADGRRARVRTCGTDRDGGEWSLQRLTPAANFVAALAVQGHEGHVRFWDCQSLLNG